MQTKNLLYPTLLLTLIASANSTQAQIANSYPGDVGIENDPNVLYVEKFDDGLTNIFSRFTDTRNTAGMSLSTDIPAGGSGPNSIKISSLGGTNTGGHLFKSFPSGGFDSTFYIRYYVKYPSSSKGYIHHECIEIGGDLPINPWPVGNAGTCGMGTTRLSAEYQLVGADTLMDAYVYWGDMHSWNGGSSCYGNVFVNHSPAQQYLKYDKWICIEIMIKLNNPVTAYNGEMRIWQDGVQAGYWGPGFPNGHWLTDKWYNVPTDPPFQGFRWRQDANLKITWIWINHYDDTSPNGVTHYTLFDNMVLANKYIGPLKTAAGISENQEASLAADIYPNPATEELTLFLPNSTSPKEVNIYNTLGKKVVAFDTSEEKTDLNISKLASGVYMFEVRDGNKISRQKFIKQ